MIALFLVTRKSTRLELQKCIVHVFRFFKRKEKRRDYGKASVRWRQTTEEAPVIRSGSS